MFQKTKGQKAKVPMNNVPKDNAPKLAPTKNKKGQCSDYQLTLLELKLS